jgi:phosphoadenosine phosphosulfate reductase
MDRIDATTLEPAVAKARDEGVDRDAERLLEWAFELFGEGLMMSTAFGKSGMCILHMAKDLCPGLPIYFLDTGFHFRETLDFLDTLRETWNVHIVAKRPKIFGIEFVRKFGEKLYETDPDLCCHNNKVEPFRELFGEDGAYQAWIAGVRRDQSSTRAQAEGIELMEGGLVKIQPLVYWTRDRVEEYLEEHKIPLHPLLSQGYPSVGCEPCTRPATDPNDERSGRWAGKAKTECGLHTFWKKKDSEAEEKSRADVPTTAEEPPPAQAAG